MKRGPEHSLEKPDEKSAFATSFTLSTPPGSPRFRRYAAGTVDSKLITALKALPSSQNFLLYGLEEERAKYRKDILPILEGRDTPHTSANVFLTIDDIHREYARQIEKLNKALPAQTVEYEKFGRFEAFANIYIANLSKYFPDFNLIKNSYIRAGCQLAIEAARDANIEIYFITDGVDINTAIDASIKGFTSSELRHIHRLYNENPELVAHVKFYAQGQEVSKESYFSTQWATCCAAHIDKITLITPLKMEQKSLKSTKNLKRSPITQNELFAPLTPEDENKPRRKLFF